MNDRTFAALIVLVLLAVLAVGFQLGKLSAHIRPTTVVGPAMEVCQLPLP